MKLEIIDIKKIKVRKENPNVMSKKQLEALKKSIVKYGELQPVIIDQNNTLIDGHQRKQAYEELGKLQIPFIRVDLKKDSDKRLLSQIMNKIKGSHDPELDMNEYKKILADFGMETLTDSLAISEQEVLNLINSMDKDEKETIEGVDKLYDIELECPKCHYKWKKQKS